MSSVPLLLRTLTLSLLFAFVTNVRADAETAHFLEHCHVYKNESDSHDFGVWLNNEKLKLAKHGVPIKLVLSKCDSLRFRIGLPAGKFTYVETDYPKIEDPDNKGNQYFWEPMAPSDAYWLFRFYGWEWAGWRMIHRVTGRVVETVNECSDAPISVGAGFIATICSGNYENVTPTLYVADIRLAETRWSGGLVLGGCQERDRFVLDEMRFKDATRLSVRGHCSKSDSGSRKSMGHAKERIAQIFVVTESGVATQQGSNDLFTGWK